MFSSDLDTPPNQNSRYDGNRNKDTVDVRYFGLFFSLQLFLQRSKMSSSIDNTRDKNPYNQNNYTSPLSSPRGKGSTSLRSNSQSGLEYQIILNFIKSNMKLFLRLIASDIHNTETSLNSNEFNTLKFFFKIPKPKEINNSTSYSQNLSSFAPFFVNFSPTVKINIETITEWLTNAINNNNINLNTSINMNTEFEDMVFLKNLSKCVTIKDNISNKNLKISHCEDSYIYINSSLTNAKISNCNNCTIVVAACSKIVSIDKCENCHITIATNLLRVSNTIDTIIYSYSQYEPILYGDNRGLSLAPHNIYYDGLLTIFKNAKLVINTTWMLNFFNPVVMNEIIDKSQSLNQGSYSIIQSKDFSCIVTPFNSQNCDNNNSIAYFLTPKEYLEILKEKEFLMSKIKSMIKDANLLEEQEKALHVALQGYFREWLVNSGNIKPMTEIVKMIDFNMNVNSNVENIDKLN